MPAPRLRRSVVVRAPRERVFRILGDSSNARKWSVFVHHITPIGKVPDGQLGSQRRCFVREDETGKRWDEELVEVVPNERRRITIFDAVEFPVSAEGLVTEQVYEDVGGGYTRLTFTLGFLDGRASLSDRVKFWALSPVIGSIFERNLRNIRALAEDEERYTRVHPFRER